MMERFMLNWRYVLAALVLGGHSVFYVRPICDRRGPAPGKRTAPCDRC